MIEKELLMLDKDVGRLRLSSSAQYSKALLPMLVTETGMPMCVRLPHWLKAYSLRGGYGVGYVHYSRLAGRAADKGLSVLAIQYAVNRLVDRIGGVDHIVLQRRQSWKAELLMLSVVAGMLTVFSSPHSLKASSPILVSLLGSEMEVRLVQCSNAWSGMLVTSRTALRRQGWCNTKNSSRRCWLPTLVLLWKTMRCNCQRLRCRFSKCLAD